jgi:hypothetical protein
MFYLKMILLDVVTFALFVSVIICALLALSRYAFIRTMVSKDRDVDAATTRLVFQKKGKGSRNKGEKND